MHARLCEGYKRTATSQWRLMSLLLPTFAVGSVQKRLFSRHESICGS